MENQPPAGSYTYTPVYQIINAYTTGSLQANGAAVEQIPNLNPAQLWELVDNPSGNPMVLDGTQNPVTASADDGTPSQTQQRALNAPGS